MEERDQGICERQTRLNDRGCCTILDWECDEDPTSRCENPLLTLWILGRLGYKAKPYKMRGLMDGNNQDALQAKKVVWKDWGEGNCYGLDDKAWGKRLYVEYLNNTISDYAKVSGILHQSPGPGFSQLISALSVKCSSSHMKQGLLR